MLKISKKNKLLVIYPEMKLAAKQLVGLRSKHFSSLLDKLSSFLNIGGYFNKLYEIQVRAINVVAFEKTGTGKMRTEEELTSGGSNVACIPTAS